MQPIIITGGPGAGKTTLLKALSHKGYLTFPEVSRTLIQQQANLDNGVLPWTNLPAFAELCLEVMSEQRRLAQKGAMPAFVDRAIPDICAYLTVGGEMVSQHYLDAAVGYASRVFFCAPHEAIYQKDDERPHSFVEAQAIHEQLIMTYEALNYEVMQVPWGSVEERACWVLAHL